MKNLYIYIVITLSLLATPGWSEEISIDDLVYRNDTYYKRFTDVPFSGKLTGRWQGKIKKGKEVGYFKMYTADGRLEKEGKFKKGKKVGKWTSYCRNGKTRIIRNYNNSGDGMAEGKTSGHWCADLSTSQRRTMRLLGQYKNGKKEGYWNYWYSDGEILEELTGTFKNGIRVSN